MGVALKVASKHLLPTFYARVLPVRLNCHLICLMRRSAAAQGGMSDLPKRTGGGCPLASCWTPTELPLTGKRQGRSPLHCTYLADNGINEHLRKQWKGVNQSTKLGVGVAPTSIRVRCQDDVMCNMIATICLLSTYSSDVYTWRLFQNWMWEDLVKMRVKGNQIHIKMEVKADAEKGQLAKADAATIEVNDLLIKRMGLKETKLTAADNISCSAPPSLPLTWNWRWQLRSSSPKWHSTHNISSRQTPAAPSDRCARV